MLSPSIRVAAGPVCLPVSPPCCPVFPPCPVPPSARLIPRRLFAQQSAAATDSCRGRGGGTDLLAPGRTELWHTRVLGTACGGASVCAQLPVGDCRGVCAHTHPHVGAHVWWCKRVFTARCGHALVLVHAQSVQMRVRTRVSVHTLVLAPTCAQPGVTAHACPRVRACTLRCKSACTRVPVSLHMWSSVKACGHTPCVAAHVCARRAPRRTSLCQRTDVLVPVIPVPAVLAPVLVGAGMRRVCDEVIPLPLPGDATAQPCAPTPGLPLAGDVAGHPQGRVPRVAPSHGGPISQVTGARGWADAFPEDTVADHVADTQGRRYYRHLSDDEDLVASGGEGTPGGHQGGWVLMPP